MTPTVHPQKKLKAYLALLPVGALLLVSTVGAFFNLSRDEGWLSFFGLSLIGITIALLVLILRQSFLAVSEIATGSRVSRASTEDRLDELERLKRRDMVTPEEYATKRQEILKDL